MIPSPNEQLGMQGLPAPQAWPISLRSRPIQLRLLQRLTCDGNSPCLAGPLGCRWPSFNGSRFFSARSGSAELDEILFPVRLPKQCGCRRISFDGSHVSQHRKTVRRIRKGNRSTQPEPAMTTAATSPSGYLRTDARGRRSRAVNGTGL